MKNFRNILATLMFVVMATGTMFGQVSFSAQAPRQVVQGNKFNITFVLKNAEGSGFRDPSVGGCTKMYGPALSTSYSSQWVNGVSSSSSSQEYSMMYRADKSGNYTVGSAHVMVNGRQYSSKPFTIQILPPDKSASSSRQSQSVQLDNIDSQSSSSPLNKKDLFVRINLSKSRVYEQEAVVCTIKLYTKYQISQFMPTLQPSFNGFLIEELPISPNLNNVERVNGENFMVAELKKCILFPQQSGKLTITSGNYDVTAIQYDIIRSIFGTIRQPVEKKLQVKSNSASVYISPLPTPKPASFTGAVGQFNVSTSIKPNSWKTYEAAAYSYVVSGSGNIKYLKSPTINFPSQFDVYDPQTTINAKPNGGTVSGSIKFEYTFIPQFVGKYEIPANQFTYFNPSTGKYVTISTQKYTLDVAKGSGTPSSARKGLEAKNTDILHIKVGDMNLQKNHDLYLSEFSYWLFYIIPLLVLGAILFYYRKTLKERANVQLMKTKRASKVAKKRLKTAKSFMVANDSNKFYAEMLTAIWGYLSDKLGLPVSELNKENISAELDKYGVGEENISEVISLLDKCEFAQYAPELSNTDMGKVYEEASEIMNKLENVKRK